MIRDGKLVQTSVSEVTTADPSQTGGCLRRWWIERAMDLRPDQHADQAEGEAGHAHLAHYLETGEPPKGRKLMGKAATGAIVKGDLPKPGPDLVIEQRLDGTPRPDAGAPWPDLIVADSISIAGVPFDGFIDLAFRRGPVPEVWDHKFFTPVAEIFGPDPYANLAKPSGLIRTVQLPVYAASQRPYWPDADRWRLVHHYVSKKGVDSRIVSAVVTNAEIDQRLAEIAGVVETMKAHVAATDQNDVAANLKSCSAWRGCPHQSICSAYRERNTVQLTPEELAIFGDLPAEPMPAPVAEAKPQRRNLIADPPPPPAPEPGSDFGDLDLPPDDSAEAPPAPALAAFAGERASDRDARGAIETIAAAHTEPAPAPVASAPPAEPAPACKCGEALNPDNASRLQSGAWVHVGCKLNAPPPPAPRQRKPRTPKADPAQPALVEKSAAPAPVEAPATQPEPAPTVPVNVPSLAPRPPVAPVAVPEVMPDGGLPVVAHMNGSGYRNSPADAVVAHSSRETIARVALAETLEGIAKLLRSVS